MEEKENVIKEHISDISRLFGAAILFVVALAAPLPHYLTLTLYILSAAVAGIELIINFFKNVIRLKFLDENTLMLIASVTAFVIGEYFEGALIVILFGLGELLEDIATDNSKNKIAGLAELKSVSVRVVTADGVKEVEPESVDVESIIEVRKGDRVPLDGVLVGGTAELDMKAITGESKLYAVEAGEKVYGGAVNIGDRITVRTEKPYKDSTAERIISLVENAESGKAKSQKFITTFAKIYTPLVVLAAVLLAVVPPLFDGMDFMKWIYKALSFLVISCPCALVISVPLAYFIGIGSLAKRGILVKGGNYIDALKKARTIVFDKTGTLTEGNFAVEKVIAFGDATKEEVMIYASSLEKSSSHPIARAIALYGADTVAVENLKEISGRGVSGVIDGKTVLAGNEKFLKENRIEVESLSESGTAIHVAADGRYLGAVVLGDKIKQNAAETIRKLKALGIKETVILSGDKEETAREIGEAAGIDRTVAELLPDKKAEELKKIMEKGATVYVGDGINDSPSLAIADVGISMGGLGSEAAVESSDVVILDDDLEKIPSAIRFSKKIGRTVTANIVFSLSVKVAVMILSTVTTLPVWAAMLADVGVMLLAVANSLKNRKVK